MRTRNDIDHAIAAIAVRQEGIIDHGQLVALGLSPQAITRRLARGSLHPHYVGVYSVGHPTLTAGGRHWAAVRACGPAAVLSDTTGGHAWGLRRTASPLIHVTVPPTSGRRSRRGLRIHRRALDADEVTTLDGLPITTPQRTLIDLAAAAIPRSALEAAFHHAEEALRMDWGELGRLLERHTGRPGVRRLDTILARYRAADTRSELERIVQRLCADHGIPRPQVNVIVEGKLRDFYWPDANLVVEADSYTWHHSPTALNDDRERDVELTLAGVRFLRFTYEQCTERVAYVRQAILAGLVVVSTSHTEVETTIAAPRGSRRRRGPGGRP